MVDETGLSFKEYLKLISFEEWLQNQKADLSDDAIALLRTCWNFSLTQACDLFGENEGTDYGTEDALRSGNSG